MTIEKHVDILHKNTEDANEILFFVQDIFALCRTSNNKIAAMMANALLNYGYLPVIVRSLCSMKLKPFLQLSTCLYILTQTFHIIKDSQFITMLFKSIFLDRIP